METLLTSRLNKRYSYRMAIKTGHPSAQRIRNELVQAICDSAPYTTGDGLLQLWDLAERNDLLGEHTQNGRTVEQILLTCQAEYDRRHPPIAS